MPRTLRRWSFLKKSPRHLGSDPGGSPEGHSHRTVVAGRGARGPEEQDRPPLGQTRHPAPRPARSADEFGLHLRGDLPPGGKGAALVMPRCDTQAMSLHLAEVAQAVAPGAHGVMLMDRAGWHRTKDLVVPDNLTLVLLPARAPELNPVENIWPFLRDNWLSSRVFPSYRDIVDHCGSAWNRLIDQPWIIMSIVITHPPHRTVFMLSNQKLTPISSRCHVESNRGRDTS